MQSVTNVVPRAGSPLPALPPKQVSDAEFASLLGSLLAGTPQVSAAPTTEASRPEPAAASRNVSPPAHDASNAVEAAPRKREEVVPEKPEEAAPAPATDRSVQTGQKDRPEAPVRSEEAAKVKATETETAPPASDPKPVLLQTAPRSSRVTAMSTEAEAAPAAPAPPPAPVVIPFVRPQQDAVSAPEASEKSSATVSVAVPAPLPDPTPAPRVPAVAPADPAPSSATAPQAVTPVPLVPALVPTPTPTAESGPAPADSQVPSVGVAEPVTASASSNVAKSAGPMAMPIVERIARIVQMQAGQNGGRLRMMLQPPHLGVLKLDVVVRSGIVFTKMEAETAAARQLLQSHLGDLRHSLECKGLSVGQMSVSVDGGGDPNVNDPRQENVPVASLESWSEPEQDTRPEARLYQILDVTV